MEIPRASARALHEDRKLQTRGRKGSGAGSSCGHPNCSYKTKVARSTHRAACRTRPGVAATRCRHGPASSAGRQCARCRYRKYVGASHHVVAGSHISSPAFAHARVACACHHVGTAVAHGLELPIPLQDAILILHCSLAHTASRSSSAWHRRTRLNSVPSWHNLHAAAPCSRGVDLVRPLRRPTRSTCPAVALQTSAPLLYRGLGLTTPAHAGLAEGSRQSSSLLEITAVMHACE
jgi:hypothetical protein